MRVWVCGCGCAGADAGRGGEETLVSGAPDTQQTEQTEQMLHAAWLRRFIDDVPAAMQCAACSVQTSWHVA